MSLAGMAQRRAVARGGASSVRCLPIFSFLFAAGTRRTPAVAPGFDRQRATRNVGNESCAVPALPLCIERRCSSEKPARAALGKLALEFHSLSTVLHSKRSTVRACIANQGTSPCRACRPQNCRAECCPAESLRGWQPAALLRIESLVAHRPHSGRGRVEAGAWLSRHSELTLHPGHDSRSQRPTRRFLAALVLVALAPLWRAVLRSSLSIGSSRGSAAAAWPRCFSRSAALIRAA